jgi:hypothetical protein
MAICKNCTGTCLDGQFRNKGEERFRRAGRPPGKTEKKKKGRNMHTGIKRMIGLVVLLMTGAVQAAVIGLNTFSNDYVGTYSVTLSGATTNGFKETYTATNTGSSYAIASAGVAGGPVTLDVGKSAVLTYKYTGGKITSLDHGWRWGLDFGDTAIQIRADAGAPGGTFLNVGFVTANGALTNASSGTLKSDWSTNSAAVPASNYWFEDGNNNVEIQTTVTRNSTTNYTISVLWGGNTYAYTTNAPTLDGTIDSVYLGSGRATSGGVAVGDNYTISDISLSVIPEPVTIGMVGFGALVLMLVRRSWRK